ncbi:MAG TPA: hypothetical protein VJQ52_18900 [Steroidobacteraceae bacterium]|nr:hypothetical protein [Steroidobacteraceae bacterium]
MYRNYLYGLVAGAASILLCPSAHAAPVMQTTQVVATTPEAQARLPAPIDFTVSTAGSYVVTLRDVNAFGLLGELSAIVTRDLQVVARVDVDYPAGGQAPAPATKSFTAAAGDYRIHVIGAGVDETRGGTYAISVVGGGTTLVDAAGAIGTTQGPEAGTSVLQEAIEFAAAGSYQLAVTDHAFPAALSSPPLVLLTRRSPNGPVIVAQAPGPFTTDAGTHDLIVIATAADPDKVGMYSVRIDGGALVYQSTNPVGGMAAPVDVAIAAGGTYTLTLADASFPDPLGSFGALVAQAGAVLGSQTGTGSLTLNPVTGTVQLFTFGRTTDIGAFAVRLSQASSVRYADVHIVDASSDPTTPAIHAFAPATPVAAGNYVLNVADFRFPLELPSLHAAVVQGDAIVDRLDHAGALDVTLQAGAAKVLVAAVPPPPTPGTPPQPNSGLFGIELSTAAGADVLESTQGVGGLFLSTPVDVPATGRYDFTLRDLQFPVGLRGSALAVTRGTELIVQAFGDGTVARQIDAGTYVLNFLGQPAGTQEYGAYGLGVAESAPAPTVTLTANPATITSGQSTTLQWNSTGATACSASNGWSGAKDPSGTQQVGPLTSGATYELRCTGPGGSAAATATVTVNAPAPGGGGGGGGGGSLTPVALIYMALAAGLRRRRQRS